MLFFPIHRHPCPITAQVRPMTGLLTLPRVFLNIPNALLNKWRAVSRSPSPSYSPEASEKAETHFDPLHLDVALKSSSMADVTTLLGRPMGDSTVTSPSALSRVGFRLDPLSLSGIADSPLFCAQVLSVNQ